MEPRSQPVVLILADISGYTRFMLASQQALVHGQQMITGLLEAILREVEVPLQVKELEGDAVFLYALKPADPTQRELLRRLLGRKLVAFFEAFARTILEASESALCPCSLCQHLEQLKLKIVVHSGEALFHQVGGFAEVSGVDVILAHRLLKNSVPGDEYVLMTETAYRDIELPSASDVVKGEERYEGFGSVPTFTWYRKGGGAPEPAAVARFYASPASALATQLRWLVRDYFGQIPFLLGLRPPPRFADLGSPRVRRGVRVALALGYLVLAPLLAPVLAFVQVARVLARRERAVAPAA